jgi:hypothetical protein
MELSVKERIVLEAFQSGRKQLNQIFVTTNLSKIDIKTAVVSLCEKCLLTKFNQAHYEATKDIFTAPVEVRDPKKEFIIKHYKDLPRRELAAKLGMTKTELNQLLIDWGIGK